MPPKSRRKTTNATETTFKNEVPREPSSSDYEEDPPVPLEAPLAYDTGHIRRTLTAQRNPTPLDALAVRDAVPPPDGYRYSPDGRLVPTIESAFLELDDMRGQAVFCEILEVTGSWQAACDTLGIKNPQVAKTFLAKNPQFALAVESAANRHRDRLYQHAVQRATVGHQVPIIGGRNKDQVVAYETKYSDALLALLLKRHFPEFREKAPTTQVTNTTINVNRPDMAKQSKEQRALIKQLLISKPPEAEPIQDVVIEEDSITGATLANGRTVIDVDPTDRDTIDKKFDPGDN